MNPGSFKESGRKAGLERGDAAGRAEWTQRSTGAASAGAANHGNSEAREQRTKGAADHG
ncbi:hypothetical protein ACE6ED_27795 [Paenibacillus sp. CN-4]|uniref:hypothetical protein n=1 Tax=Paenibacillus nanchangensis TaxID=3348343 RepID=UPI00397BD0D1